MCGIAGIVNFRSQEPQAAILNRMLRAMAHRGPDATGLYLSDTCGLGHARLSIIDLSGGHQPMHNEDRSVWIVFNGEIFNYPELRAALVRRGHRFYTQSDTEVIIHLYEEYGPDVFAHLNGQFAIALWDQRKRRLLLGRDRVGIRPLYYHLNAGRLHFASEIKALFSDARVPRRLDSQTLSDVFTCWTPVDPSTAFVDIAQLPPGHLAVFDADGLRLTRYWQLHFDDEAEPGERSFEDWAEEMKSVLLDAARIRLRADVPVGAYLSGGIDSTYISTLVKRNFNNRPSMGSDRRALPARPLHTGPDHLPGGLSGQNAAGRTVECGHGILCSGHRAGRIGRPVAGWLDSSAAALALCVRFGRGTDALCHRHRCARPAPRPCRPAFRPKRRRLFGPAAALGTAADLFLRSRQLCHLFVHF